MAVHSRGVAQSDSTATHKVREPSQKKIEAFANDDAFNYSNTPKETDTTADKIKYWLQRQFSKILQTAAEGRVLKILFYIGLATLILMLINQYMKDNLKHVFWGKESSKPDNFELHQNYPEMENLEKLIQHAIHNREFNTAIGYLYQKSLRDLQRKGYITWKKNKTNHDYIHEVNRSELREILRHITRFYEYTEYGNFAINHADFQKMREHFKKMQTLVDATP